MSQDYTCVPRKQLARAFHLRFNPDGERLSFVADRVGQDVRDLKRIVNGPTEPGEGYLTTGLDLADRILLAIGQNITHLEMIDEITVIPTSDRGALHMAADEMCAHGAPIPDDLRELNDTAYGRRLRRKLRNRADELMKLREETLAVWT